MAPAASFLPFFSSCSLIALARRSSAPSFPAVLAPPGPTAAWKLTDGLPDGVLDRGDLVFFLLPSASSIPARAAALLSGCAVLSRRRGVLPRAAEVWKLSALPMGVPFRLFGGVVDVRTGP